jgi:hypothetical protein
MTQGVVVIVERQRDLLNVVGAGHAFGSIARLGYCGKEQRNEDSDKPDTAANYQADDDEDDRH